MAKKADREWSTRTEATKALAENEKLTGAQLAAFLFHSTPERILADAAAQRGAVIAAKREQFARLQAELAQTDKPNVPVVTTK